MADQVNPEVEAFLADYPAPVRELALETRAFVLGVLPPAVVERVYPGWHTIGYGADGKMAGQVCYIAPTKAGVTLGFNRGAVLPDLAGLLTGTGKLLRHVKIRQAADLANPDLRMLLASAGAEAAP